MCTSPDTSTGLVVVEVGGVFVRYVLAYSLVIVLCGYEGHRRLVMV